MTSMNGRVYSLQLDTTAETTAFDVFEIKANNARPLEIMSLHLSQLTVTGDANEEVLLVQWKSGQTTQGTGGAVLAPLPRVIGDVAAAFTCNAHNHTTQASAGVPVTHWSTYWNMRMPLDLWLPPEQFFYLKPNEWGTFSVDIAPAGSTNFSAVAVVKELG